MIYEVNSHYVISSGGSWLPGSYDSERTARLAFRLSDATLQRIQDRVNANESIDDRTVTYDMVLASLRKQELLKPPKSGE
jgi:hypothetical protein